MMNSQTLECSLPLPPSLDCDRCLSRLQTEICRIRGVLQAGINRTQSTISITYEPSLMTFRNLESEARQISTKIAANTAHKVIDLCDLHCPDCATILEKDTRRLTGVYWAEVRFTATQLIVEFDTSQISLEEICNNVSVHGVRACPVQALPETDYSELKPRQSPSGSLFKRLSRVNEAILSTLIIVLALLPDRVTNGRLDPYLYSFAILLCSHRIVQAAWGAIRARAIDMNVLVLVAVMGAMGLNEWFEGATVVLLYNVGNLLQIQAMERTRRSIRALMDVGPKTACVVRGLEEVSVPVEKVRIHEIVIVKPGERIPMDGEIIEGSTTIDEAPITGESFPVRKCPGDRVYGGSLNGTGTFSFLVTDIFQDTVLARILHRVEEAQAQRAPVQEFIDRFAQIYTPVVIGLATLIAIIPPVGALLWSQVHGFPPDYSQFTVWFSRALAMLLISCPCALVISTPVAIVTAIGSATRHGVLIKGGIHLEIAANLRVMLYDKTGTLTYGKCRVEEIIPLEGASKEQIMELALALERNSEHPLASAFLYAAQDYSTLREIHVTDFRAIPGGGICGMIDGEMYLLGNAALLQQHMISMDEVQMILRNAEESGKTVVVISTLHKPLGLVVIGDEPRPDFAAAIQELEKLGIQHQAILTGDNPFAAKNIGQVVGIQDIHARLLPEDKLKLIHVYREQYGSVGMVGDGINDAPALASANLGIVMGATGSDVAMETADVALMANAPGKLPYLIRLSRKTQRIVRQNILFSLITKGMLLLTAMVAGVPLWLAVIGDVGVSLIVTLNALRLCEGKNYQSRTIPG